MLLMLAGDDAGLVWVGGAGLGCVCVCGKKCVCV
jgi:hypothetical protein